MEYIYSAMLLHSGKKEISEDSVSKILKSAGLEADSSRVKALIASLKDVSIDEAIAKAAVAQVAVAAPQASTGEAKKEEKPEDTAKAQEAAAEGLASLFG